MRRPPLASMQHKLNLRNQLGCLELPTKRQSLTFIIPRNEGRVFKQTLNRIGEAFIVIRPRLNNIRWHQ